MCNSESVIKFNNNNKKTIILYDSSVLLTKQATSSAERITTTISTGPYARLSEGGFEMERKVTKNELSLQVHHESRRGVWARLRAPEAERLYWLCLVHARSSLDFNSDFH